MAIVKSADGRYFEIEDEVLASKEIKPEQLPEEARRPGLRPSGRGPMQGGPAAPPGGGQPIHVTINIGGGGSGGMNFSIDRQGPHPMGGPPGETGGGAPAQAPSGAEKDVEGHWYYWYGPTYYYGGYYWYGY